MDKAVLQDLLARVEAATGPDIDLDVEIACALVFPNRGRRDQAIDTHPEFWRGYIFTDTGFLMADSYTSSIEAAIKVFQKLLPEWWWTTGVCNLTGDASIGPDYNGPDGERLHREFPEAEFDDGIHRDLGPKGGGRDRAARALIACTLQALITIQEREAANVD